MCSICGYFSHNKILKKNNVGQLTNKKSSHLYGHSRLSIMGKDNSIQPFTSCFSEFEIDVYDNMFMEFFKNE